MSGVRREAPHASSIVVRAGPEALIRVADWIRARGDAHALAPALLDRIDVCAAELVANVLEHGLGGVAQQDLGSGLHDRRTRLDRTTHAARLQRDLRVVADALDLA